MEQLKGQMLKCYITSSEISNDGVHLNLDGGIHLNT